MQTLTSRQQAGASSSIVAHGQSLYLRPLCRRAQQHVVVASSRSSGSAETFSRDAQAATQRAFKQMKGKWDAFAREQRLEQRANDALNTASVSARELAGQAKEKARRMFIQLDSEYELTAKTARAAKRAEEVARDIDQNYGVRRRLRSTSDYVVRQWPAWQRQLDSFSSTWYGKATVFAGICLLVSTPFFWSVLNALLLLWWISLPLSVFLLDYARKQQAERLQQEAERLEREQRAANPFSDLFGGAWGARGGMNGGMGGRGGASRSRYTQQDGPVIDAEWTSLDDGDSSGSAKGRWRR